jgi:hypothetical protein
LEIFLNPFLGFRPFACTLCEKTYGRRDYLQRHLKSHNASYAVNLASAGGISAAQVVHAVSMAKSQQLEQQKTISQPIVVQMQQGDSFKKFAGTDVTIKKNFY